MGYALAIAAAACYGLNWVLQHHEAAQAGKDAESKRPLALLWHLLHRPVWLLGLAALITGSVLQAAALALSGLAIVEPMLIGSLPFALAIGSRLYDERVAVVHWVGAAAICAGLATLIAVAAPTRSHQVGADARWLAGGGLTGAVVVVLVLAAARVRSSPQGFLLATAAAVAWGLSDALNKAAFNAGERGSLELLRAGQTYAFVGVAVVALTLTQLAFRVAALPVCLPSLAVGEPVVGLFLGIVVLSVRLRHSALAIAVEAVAGAVIVAGAVPLARAPVVAGQG